MSDIRYVYVRDLPVGKVVKTSLYDMPKKRTTTDITVAYRFDDENQQVVYNSARRGKKDFFRRATGRAVASGRLAANTEKHPNQTIPYSDVSTSGGPKYSLISNRITQLFGAQQKYGKKVPHRWGGAVVGVREVPELAVRPSGQEITWDTASSSSFEPEDDMPAYENPPESEF